MLRTVKNPHIAPRLLAGKVVFSSAGTIPEVASASIGKQDLPTTAAKGPLKATMAFDGIDDGFITTYSPDLAGGLSGVVVCSLKSLGAERSFLECFPSTDADKRLQFFMAPTAILRGRVNNGTNYVGRNSAAGLVAVDEVAVLAFTYDGGTTASGVKLYKNGTQVDATDDTSGSYSVPAVGSGVLSIGKRPSGSAYPFSGTLAECLMVDGELTATQILQISSHLMNKYGIGGAPLGPDYTLDIGTVSDLDIWLNADNVVTTAAGAISSATAISPTSIAATQATGSAQPEIASGGDYENFIPYSETLSDASWTKTNATVSGRSLRETAATGAHTAAVPVGVVHSATKLAFEARITPVGRTFVTFGYNQTSNISIGAELSGAGALFTFGTDMTARSVTANDDGSYTIYGEISTGPGSATAATLTLGLRTDSSTSSYAGDTAKGVDVHYLRLRRITKQNYPAGTGAQKIRGSLERIGYADMTLAQGFSRKGVCVFAGEDLSNSKLIQIRTSGSSVDLPDFNLVNSSGTRQDGNVNFLALGWDAVNDYTNKLQHGVMATAADPTIYSASINATGPVLTGTTGLTLTRPSTGVYQFTFKRPGRRDCLAFPVGFSDTAGFFNVKNEDNAGFQIETRNSSGTLVNTLSFNVIALSFGSPLIQGRLRRALKADQRRPRMLGGLFTGGSGTTDVVGNGTEMSIARTGTGLYTLTFTTPFARVPVVLPQALNKTIRCQQGATASVSAITLRFLEGASTLVDPTDFGVIALGFDEVRVY